MSEKEIEFSVIGFLHFISRSSDFPSVASLSDSLERAASIWHRSSKRREECEFQRDVKT